LDRQSAVSSSPGRALRVPRQLQPPCSSWTLPIRVAVLAAGPAQTGVSRWRAFRGRLAAGVAVARHDHGAQAVLAGFMAQVVVRGILGVLLVVASVELLGLGEAGVGWLTSAIGLGGLLGALGCATLVARERLAAPFAIALLGWGLPIAAIGLVPAVAPALAALIVVGASNAALDVAGFTLLQRVVPNEARAPVLGLLEGMVGLGVAAGSAIGPLLIVWLGPRGSLLATGAILPVVALVTWPALAIADDRAVIPRHELRLLRSLPFFAPLPLTAIEDLARRLRPVTFDVGDELTRQGDPGDCFYLIDDGAVEIERDGRPVAAAGPAAAVGEIALLRGVPRTATVRATRSTRAYALAGPDFIAAVTASPLAAAAADAVVARRVPEVSVGA
jgi:MFS family permease